MADAIEPITDQTLQAFLDDLLQETQMIEIEQRLREDSTLREQLNSLIASRDQGAHSIGDIWRRHRLSCPTREELGSYLLGAMTDEQLKYVELHLQHVGCRYCQSNLDDLHRQQSITPSEASQRRQKYFQSSVGKLKS